MKQRPKEGLEKLLQKAFGYDIDVKTFIPRWEAIHPDDYFTLGRKHLGIDMLLGTTLLCAQQQLTIHLKIDSWASCLNFLNSPNDLQTLLYCIEGYLGHRCQYQIQLSFPKHTYTPWQLGAAYPLGYSHWFTNNNHPRKKNSHSTEQGTPENTAKLALSDQRLSIELSESLFTLLAFNMNQSP